MFSYFGLRRRSTATSSERGRDNEGENSVVNSGLKEESNGSSSFRLATSDATLVEDDDDEEEEDDETDEDSNVDDDNEAEGDSSESAKMKGDFDFSQTQSSNVAHRKVDGKGKAKAIDVDLGSPMSPRQEDIIHNSKNADVSTRPPLRPAQRSSQSRSRPKSTSSVNVHRSRSTIPSSSFISPDPYSHSVDANINDSESSFGYDLSIIVALVSPIGNWLTGGDHVKNVLLMLLLIFYLHQVVEVPWSLYKMSIPRHPPPPATRSPSDADTSKHDDSAIQHPAHHAHNALLSYSTFYLVLSLLSPVLGALLLHFVAKSVTGNEHALSWFSTTLFVLATGVRPWSHLVNRARGRAGALQGVVKDAHLNANMTLGDAVDVIEEGAEILLGEDDDEREGEESSRRNTNAEITKLNSEIIQMNSSLTTLYTRLSSLYSTASSHTSSIADLQTHLKDVIDLLERAMKVRQQELAQIVTVLDGRIEDNERRLKGLESLELEGRVVRVERGLERVEMRLSVRDVVGGAVDSGLDALSWVMRGFWSFWMLPIRTIEWFCDFNSGYKKTRRRDSVNRRNRHSWEKESGWGFIFYLVSPVYIFWEYIRPWPEAESNISSPSSISGATEGIPMIPLEGSKSDISGLPYTPSSPFSPISKTDDPRQHQQRRHAMQGPTTQNISPNSLNGHGSSPVHTRLDSIPEEDGSEATALPNPGGADSQSVAHEEEIGIDFDFGDLGWSLGDLKNSLRLDKVEKDNKEKNRVVANGVKMGRIPPSPRLFVSSSTSTAPPSYTKHTDGISPTTPTATRPFSAYPLTANQQHRSRARPRIHTQISHQLGLGNKVRVFTVYIWSQIWSLWMLIISFVFAPVRFLLRIVWMILF